MGREYTDGVGIPGERQQGREPQTCIRQPTSCIHSQLCSALAVLLLAAVGGGAGSEEGTADVPPLPFRKVVTLELGPSPPHNCGPNLTCPSRSWTPLPSCPQPHHISPAKCALLTGVLNQSPCRPAPPCPTCSAWCPWWWVLGGLVQAG